MTLILLLDVRVDEAKRSIGDDEGVVAHRKNKDIRCDVGGFVRVCLCGCVGERESVGLKETWGDDT